MEKTSGAASIMNLAAQAGLANLPNIGKQVQQTGGVSFSETFMKTSEVKSVEINPEQTTKTTTAVDPASKSMSGNIKNAKEMDTQQTDKSLDSNEMKDLVKEIEDITGQIKEKIKEGFEVTEEEIEEAMEVLGLTLVDLTNGANLQSLVMQLTGATDSIELLTNVNLYDGLKEITSFADQLVAQVSEKFEIPKEQLAQIINSDSFKEALEVKMNPENISEDQVNLQNETSVDNKPENTVTVEVVDTTKKTEGTVTTDISKTDKAVESLDVADTDKITTVTENADAAATVKTDIKAEDEFTITPQAKVEVEVSEEARTQNPVLPNQSAENSGNKSNEFGKNNSKKDNLAENGQVTIQTTETTQTVNTVGDVVETVRSYTSYADTENVMRQVTDFVKVNITEDATEMEMRLHPASLGTVNMQISSQGGQITAHLTVQNDLVKSILESQMVRLQDTFNENGTKVSAIEISVANYNLDRDSSNNFSQSQQQSRRGGRRTINLGEIDSIENLPEEDQLQAKVMEMNGSSVNYTA